MKRGTEGQQNGNSCCATDGCNKREHAIMNGVHEIEKSMGRCETKDHENGHLHCAETFLKEGPAMRFIPLMMPHRISIALPGLLFERVTSSGVPVVVFCQRDAHDVA